MFPLNQYSTIKDNSYSGVRSLSSNQGHPHLLRNIIVNNGYYGWANDPGFGIFLQSPKISIINNTVHNNKGGVYVYQYGGGGNFEIKNNIISQNNLGSGNHQYGIWVYSGYPYIAYNDVWDNSSGNYYNCSAGTCDISQDPSFVSQINDDYHLNSNSPCIDAGDPNSPDDPDGTRLDMGAYYYDAVPESPYLNAIGANADNNPVLTWVPGSDLDIQKYLVSKTYTNAGGTNTWVIDVGNNTTYTDYGITIQKRGLTIATYKIKAVDNVGQESPFSNQRSVSGLGPIFKPVVEKLPDEYALHTAYPNPFNLSTTIQFDIPSETKVLIELYDLLGQKVCTLVQTNYQPGYHSVVWNGTNNYGSNVPSGTYFVVFSSPQHKQTQKVVLVK